MFLMKYVCSVNIVTDDETKIFVLMFKKQWIAVNEIVESFKWTSNVEL